MAIDAAIAKVQAVHKTLQKTTRRILKLKVSPCGKFIVSTCGYDLDIWNAEDGTALHSIRAHSDIISSIIIIPNYIISHSYNNKIKIWQISDGTLIHTILTMPYKIISMNYINDCIIGGTREGFVLVWRFKDGFSSLIHTYQFHNGPITTTEVYSNYLITGSTDSTIKICKFIDESIKLVQILNGHSGGIKRIAVNSKYIISYGGENSLMIWQLSNGKLLNIIPVGEINIELIIIYSDYVFCGTDYGTIMVYGITKGNFECVLRGHFSSISGLGISSKHIISGSYDREIKKWRIPNHKRTLVLNWAVRTSRLIKKI